MAMRACVGGAVLSIVTEIMTSKALCHGACRGRSKSNGVRKYLSGRGEYTSAIREVNMLGGISGDWEGTIVRVS